MIGTLIGDVVGSPYESGVTVVKNLNFPMFTGKSRFTDDTVCSCAIFESVFNDVPYHESLKKWCRKYPDRGYGKNFRKWFLSDTLTHNDSYGNGAAMRISAIVLKAITNRWTKKQLDEEIKRSCRYTHEHEESYRGSSAIAQAMYLAAFVKDKSMIENIISKKYKYNLSRPDPEDFDPIEDIRLKNFDKNDIDCSCQTTVPMALIAFLESKDFESTIRNAVYMGGDTDTVAAMAGGIAEWFYGIESVPHGMFKSTAQLWTPDIVSVVDSYCELRDWLNI